VPGFVYQFGSALSKQITHKLFEAIFLYRVKSRQKRWSRKQLMAAPCLKEGIHCQEGFAWGQDAKLYQLDETSSTLLGKAPRICSVLIGRVNPWVHNSEKTCATRSWSERGALPVHMIGRGSPEFESGVRNLRRRTKSSGDSAHRGPLEHFAFPPINSYSKFLGFHAFH
jgi:hypothetical protein